MAFEKKVWANKEDIPESELSQYPRLDAENMNRIEDGIEEAHAPEYEESAKLETLTSGEKITIALGKIKKAISDFIAHLGNKENPHKVTATQAGALPITGGTLSGSLSFGDGYGSITSDKNCTTFITKNEKNNTQNYRQIYLTNSSYNQDIADCVFVREIVNGQAEDVYRLYGEHNKPTADDIGALPVTGGTIKNPLWTGDGYGKVHGAGNGENGGIAVMGACDVPEIADSAARQIELASPKRNEDLKTAFKLTDWVNGNFTPYTIFGEHNKPNVTYSGTGDSTEQKIAVGGIGTIAYIYGGNCRAIVSPDGAIVTKGGQGGYGMSSAYCRFENGELIIATTDTAVNNKSTTYHCQVL